MKTYKVLVVRQTIEFGTIERMEVPDDVDPRAHLDELREMGDDDLDWVDDNCEDLEIEITEIKDEVVLPDGTRTEWDERLRTIT